MRTFFPLVLIVTLSLSSCNMPIRGEPEPPSGTGMPSFFTNVDTSGPPKTPSGPQVGTKMLWVDNSILVFVPGGPFTMGVEKGEDNPYHTVELSPFWIHRAEVTNSQYALCVAAGQCSMPQDLDAPTRLADAALHDHPVVGVTHAQAEAYCQWIQGDLPTEAQWEKTARGPQANLYPWGEDTPTCDLTNFNNCSLAPTSIRQHASGMSYYEALDLAGNVFEWNRDWYDAEYYRNAPPIDPPGPQNGLQRVVRGGGYQTIEADLFSARRFSLDPLLTRPDLGFRCVVNDPGLFAPFCEAGLVLTGSPLPGGGDPGGSSSSCEPPQVRVGGSYCSGESAYVNIFTDEEIGSADPLACNRAADGLWTCSGPNLHAGEVQVCGACDAPALPQPEQDGAGGLAEVPPGPGGACPNPGYLFNEATGQCEWGDDPGTPFSNGEQVFCPVGSHPDPSGSYCTAPPQPPNGQGECPNSGYFYDPQTQMCHWRRAQSRPSGICLDPQTGFAVHHSRCDPGGDIGGYTFFCPLGMEPDASGSFCVAQAGAAGQPPPAECPNGICDAVRNDFDCPVGTYFDEGVQVCVPASGNPATAACIPGFFFNEEQACCQAAANMSYPACPPGQLMHPALGCTAPPSFDEQVNASCISAAVALPDCEKPPIRQNDPPGEENPCAQHNGDYSACTSAGCSYDTLTNTCN